MNNRYVAALAIAAVVVLVAGSLIRPHATPKPPAPVEPAPQPRPIRGSDVRQISDFLGERGRRLASHVVWVPSVQASGVVWTTGQVVTVAPDTGIVQTVPAAEPSVAVRLAGPETAQQAGWIVIVARNSEGDPITAAGMLGGSAETGCGQDTVRKLLFNVPLDSAFAGGGVFDISGALLGVVVQCGGAWMALVHSSVQTLLEGQLGAPAVAWHSFGVRLREPSEAERKALRLPGSGLFVAEVRRGSQAGNMGLLPGDVLIANEAGAIDRPEDLVVLGDKLTVWRNRRQIAVAASPEFLLDRWAAAPVLAAVEPGTRLHTAGLRPGDRILDDQILNRRGPAWLVYLRGERYAGVLLP